jgi:hypothetical protein
MENTSREVVFEVSCGDPKAALFFLSLFGLVCPSKTIIRC